MNRVSFRFAFLALNSYLGEGVAVDGSKGPSLLVVGSRCLQPVVAIGREPSGLIHPSSLLSFFNLVVIAGVVKHLSVLAFRLQFRPGASLSSSP